VSGEEALLALAVDALYALVPASLIVAFTVDDSGVLERAVAGRGRPADRAGAERLAELLRRLEPVDPFSPRRAQASQAVVMSAADIGGALRFGNSIYGRRLLDQGYGCPTFLYLRRGESIVAGIGLLRGIDAPPFEVANLSLLRGLSPLLEQSLQVAEAGAVTEHAAAAAPDGVLTTRERQVATLVARGSSNADIAQALAMSQATVKTHLTKIYAKVGVRTRTQLAVVLGAGRTAARA
jgi:DNA-binding CsgD family transcriptional regulator